MWMGERLSGSMQQCDMTLVHGIRHSWPGWNTHRGMSCLVLLQACLMPMRRQLGLVSNLDA